MMNMGFRMRSGAGFGNRSCETNDPVSEVSGSGSGLQIDHGPGSGFRSAPAPPFITAREVV